MKDLGLKGLARESPAAREGRRAGATGPDFRAELEALGKWPLKAGKWYPSAISLFARRGEKANETTSPDRGR